MWWWWVGIGLTFKSIEDSMSVWERDTLGRNIKGENTEVIREWARVVYLLKKWSKSYKTKKKGEGYLRDKEVAIFSETTGEGKFQNSGKKKWGRKYRKCKCVWERQNSKIRMWKYVERKYKPLNEKEEQIWKMKQYKVRD